MRHDANATDGTADAHLALDDAAWDQLCASVTTEGIVAHADGRILRANRALAVMFGYEPDTLVGLAATHLTVPEDRPRLQAHIAAGAVEPLDGHALRRDGSTFPCRVRGRSVIVHDRVVRVVVVRDLTERQVMEAALLRRERELASIARNTPDVVTRLDRALRVRFMSAGIELATGVPADRFVGQRLDAFAFPPELTRQWHAAAGHVFASGEPMELQFVLHDAAGVPRSYHTRVVAERDERGEIVTVLATSRDLTALHAAEQSARHAEDRFRALVEHADDLLAILDTDGRNRYASPSHTRVLGVSPDALVGRSCFSLVHPEDEGVLRRLFAEATAPDHARQPTGSTPIRFAASDGRWRVLAVTLTDMRDIPAVAGIVANSRDVTDALALEERLRRAARMEALGRLAGGVAHDFNNILAAISGVAQLLREECAVDARDTADDERERGGVRHRVIESADEIVASAGRGAAIVRQLLAFSRMERADVEVLDLAALTRETARMLRALLPAHIALRVPPPERVARMLASRTALEQILVNLAVNARDAMPDGGTLTIDVRYGAGDLRADQHVRQAPLVVDTTGAAPAIDARVGVGARISSTTAAVFLEVRDTGVGIPEAIRDRIFDPFFTTKPVGHGTGLGLSTVYGLVRQLGGVLTVESTPQVGTAFTAAFPAVPAEQIATAPTDTERPSADSLPHPSASSADASSADASRHAANGGPASPTHASHGRAGGRVLLAEDEPAVRRFVERALGRAGYMVTSVADGARALDHLTRGEAFDLLLTDAMMPALDGWELAERARVLRPELPIVLMSGYTERDEQTARGQSAPLTSVDAVDAGQPIGSAGIDGYVAKPFDIAQLLRTIARVLADGSFRGEPLDPPHFGGQSLA